MQTNSFNFCFRADLFCFGTSTFEVAVSGDRLQHKGLDCCAINFINENGTIVTDATYGYEADIFDVNNNSPQFISPPIWNIQERCGGQTYHVNPVDSEGDTIRCRWSIPTEAYEIASDRGFEYFSLDEENCIVTYHPELDSFRESSKPVALQVEDFDATGNIM